MPLDPGTQYYQIGDSNAGAQPLDSSVLGIDPALDLQSAGAQAAPAAGQGLAALVQLIQHLAAPKQTAAASGPAPLVPMQPTTDPTLMANVPPSIPTVDPGMRAGPQNTPGTAAQSGPGLAPPDAPTNPLAALSAIVNAPGIINAPGMVNAPGAASAPAQASSVQPSPAAAPLTMPKMATHNNTWLQAIGALSALAGGPGGRIASQAIASQKAGDTDKYNQQVQAYQQQQKDGQQQIDNQTQQAAATGQLTETLAKLDPASQEARVRALMQSPGILSAYGYTPQSAQTQFFDKTGAFIPVTAADKPENPAALARAQVAARNSMSHMSLDGQQNYHDSFAKDPDAWTAQTGLPYDGFTPSATARDTTAAGALAEKITSDAASNSVKLSDDQNRQLQTLTSMTPKMQATMKALYANVPNEFEQKYGVPLAGWQPGMTQKDATALLGTQNREQDAQRTDATHLKIANLNVATRIGIDNENNRVAMRGQDLRAQLEGKQINARVSMFNQRYGTQNGGAAEKQYQSLLIERMVMQKRMTALSAPQKDAFGDPSLSLRDQGRIDANGNHIANPPATAAYNEYMYLAQQDKNLEAQMNSMAGTAASGTAAAPSPVAPMPVTVDSNHLSRLAPYAPPLPNFPAYTSHGSDGNSLLLPGFPQAGASPAGASRGAASQTSVRLTPAQIHGMTTQQLLLRLATRLGKR